MGETLTEIISKLANNYEWSNLYIAIFSLICTIVVGLIGFLFRKTFENKSGIKQKIKSGNGSRNFQIGNIYDKEED